MKVVRFLRFLLTVCYGSYLINVGLLLLLLPWSEVWTVFVLRFPPKLAFAVDNPSLRGAVSAFGLLHLGMILVEFISPSSIREV